MAKQTINIGTTPNDGTGDTIRDAFDKVNDNFNETYAEFALGAILSTNGTYIGETLSATVDTNSVGFGCLLAMAADFHFDEADADAAANCYMLAMALETGTGTKKVLTRGQICNTAWAWSAGAVYASTTLGTLTQTQPSGTDDVIVIVGWALSADTIFFAPYASFITHT